MDETFELPGLAFEWNADKARTNEGTHGKLGHGVSFEEAATAFMDSVSIEFPDDEHSEEEIRSYLLGRDVSGQLLRVSFTEREGRIRIFSARRADNYDERQYVTGY